MSFRGAVDVPLEIIGGLVCDTAAVELPAGVSPNCQDVEFTEDGARTRRGLGLPIAGTPLLGNVINYLKTFQTLSGIYRAMAFTDLANLYKETTPGGGAYTLITGGALPDVNIAAPYCNSATQTGREYLAISDGQFGVGLPRQYDDTNLDRVSMVGPGAGPSVADENAPFTIAAAGIPGAQMIGAANVQSASQIGFLVTLNLIGNPFGFVGAWTFVAKAGDQFTVAGVGAGYNGTWLLAADVTLSSLGNQPLTFFVTTNGLAAVGAGGTVQFPYAVIQLTTNQTASQNIPLNSQATLTGVGNAAYDGTWRVALTQFSGPSEIIVNFNQFGVASSGGGTAAIAGNISAGKHQVTCFFVTRSGFFTAAAPPTTWTAGGNKRVVVSNIPIGPQNIVVQRILAFTQAGGATFYYLTGAPGIASSNFIVPDNLTTTATVDFTDGVLAGGTNISNLFTQVELGECAGVLDYSDRMMWWGERAKINNFGLNLTFDGGFTNAGSNPLSPSFVLPNFPLGWVQDAVFAPGGASAIANAQPVVFGDAYVIGGNGATATRGKITLGLYQDALGAPIIQPNVSYSVRARILRNAALAQGTVHINAQSTLQAFTTVGIQLTQAQVTQAYVEYIAVLVGPLATVPTDLVLQVYADGTPTNGGVFVLDCIEIFPTNQPNNVDFIRVSKAAGSTGGNALEAFDGVTGILAPGQNNGQAVKTCYRFRNGLVRIVKEHSLYSTRDDATNEPSGLGGQWSITEASQIIGTPSVRGVGIGEDWAVIAHRTGLYIDWGAEPQKISQEIGHSSESVNGAPLTLAWDQINWKFGYTIWVTVDTTEKQIFVGAPFGAATSPNAVLVMDYRKIDPDEGQTGAEAIAASPPIHIRFSGVRAVFDKSRKWSPWSVSVNSCALIERPDGTQHLWMGAGSGVPGADKGAIYDVQRGQLTDYSTRQFIPSFYWTAFTPQREQNQAMQTHEHRKSFKYLTMQCEGAGLVDLQAAPGNFNTFLSPQALPSLVLSFPAYGELETNIDVKGERAAFRISASSMDTVTAPWFRLTKLTLSVMGDPTTPVRGVN